MEHNGMKHHGVDWTQWNGIQWNRKQGIGMEHSGLA